MIYSFLFIISLLALIRSGSQEINTKQKNVYNTLHTTLITPAVFYVPWC